MKLLMNFEWSFINKAPGQPALRDTACFCILTLTGKNSTSETLLVLWYTNKPTAERGGLLDGPDLTVFTSDWWSSPHPLPHWHLTTCHSTVTIWKIKSIINLKKKILEHVGFYVFIVGRFWLFLFFIFLENNFKLVFVLALQQIWGLSRVYPGSQAIAAFPLPPTRLNSTQFQ